MGPADERRRPPARGDGPICSNCTVGTAVASAAAAAEARAGDIGTVVFVVVVVTSDPVLSGRVSPVFDVRVFEGEALPEFALVLIARGAVVAVDFILLESVTACVREAGTCAAAMFSIIVPGLVCAREDVDT